jgi:dTDP-4-amino-4,6-dideoxygalactose transaminase
MRRFTDKGRLRQQASEVNTYETLAPNYRITALQAAVAIAQMEKIKERISIRYRLGSLLNELIGDCANIGLPQVVDDAKPSYWFYPFFTWAWPAGYFAKALRAEGIPTSTGMFISKPIFLCSATLCDGRTYGDSHFPFGSPYTTRRYEELYAPGVCPNVEYILEHTVMLTIHEQTEESEVRDMAQAVKKVANGLQCIDL